VKVFFAVVLFAFAIAPPALYSQTTYLCANNTKSFQELRVYEVNRVNREAFHERFADHALRLMKKYRFKVIDMWESESDGRLQFIYILSWPDKKTMETRWKAFRGDDEWAKIKQRSVEKYGDLLLSTHGQELVRVSYSPACKTRK